MECHDVRLLLAFTRGSPGEIDPTERGAIEQHLDVCADCSAVSHSEQAIDAALGAAMRDVPVPAGLKGRVITRLAAGRAPRWPRVAIAAAVLLIVGLGVTGWMIRPMPNVDSALAQRVINGQNTDPEAVERWYRDRGIDMQTWRQLDHRLLWTYDVIEFQGQRVPKLIFRNRLGGVAEVIVLRTDRFDTRNLAGIPGDTPNRIVVDREAHEGMVYLVGTTEDDLDAFLTTGAH